MPLLPLLTGKGAGEYVMNFLGGAMPPNVTFTRASQATDFNSAGTLTTEGNNVPRFDFNPLTLQPRGLLIEGARTNLITQSEQIIANTGVTVAANNANSPAGTLTADTMTADTATSAHFSLPNSASISTTTGLVYAHSVFAKAGTHNFFQLYGLGASFGVDVWANFNLSNGTVGSVGAATTASIENVGNGWYRCVVVGTATANATSGVSVLAIVSSATAVRGESWTTAGTESIQLWGSQVEQASFVSSYIPTTGAAATRADDNALSSLLSSIGYNQSQGTILLELEPMVTTPPAFQMPFSLTNGTANNRIILEHTTGGNGTWRVTDGGVSQVAGLAGLPGFTANSITKRAFAYSANSFAACSNGETVVTQGTGTVPSNLSQLALGHYAVGSINSPWFGWIRRVVYYPTRLPDAQIQSLTA